MHWSVMDGVRGVKVAAEWNGISPALQGGRGNAETFSFRSHRTIRRPKFKVHLPTVLQLLGTRKAGRRQPNRWDSVASAKKKTTTPKQQRRCFSGIGSFSNGIPDSRLVTGIRGGSIQRDAKNETHQDKGWKVRSLSYVLACRFAQFAVILTVLASSNNSDHVWCACFVPTVHRREE